MGLALVRETLVGCSFLVRLRQSGLAQSVVLSAVMDSTARATSRGNERPFFLTDGYLSSRLLEIEGLT